MVKKLLKNWKIILLVIVLFIAGLSFIFSGIHFGIDFSGGTMFQIHFAEKLKSSTQMEQVSTIIQQRLNWSGLKDIKVFNWGDEFVIAELPETDPEQVQKIESLLKKQGKFEVLIDGKIAFTGEDIIQIDQETTSLPAIVPSGDFFRWNLPFVLKNDAAKNFRDLSFHKCILTSYSASGESSYECAFTYFFIDRPSKSVIIFTEEQFYADKELLLTGNHVLGIPQNTDIDEILLNIGAPYFVVDANGFSEQQLLELTTLVSENKKALIPFTLNESIQKKLEEIGFKLVPVSVTPGEPWIWSVSGLKSIVRLQPSITGDDPFVETVEQAKIITDLVITGTEAKQEDALKDRQYTKVILESGSLPVPVESISKESISPLLGENFLFISLIIGLCVLLVVSLIIFIRYRIIMLSLAIVLTALFEAFIALTFTSHFGSITLASIAGILAVVGTGVDHQIIISDELLSGKSREEVSFFARIKRAFFIIFASASTTLATMLPVIFFGTSMIRIVGFAIATVVGLLASVLITRPAFGEIAKYLLKENE